MTSAQLAAMAAVTLAAMAAGCACAKQAGAGRCAMCARRAGMARPVHNSVAHVGCMKCATRPLMEVAASVLPTGDAPPLASFAICVPMATLVSVWRGSHASPIDESLTPLPPRPQATLVKPVPPALPLALVWMGLLAAASVCVTAVDGALCATRRASSAFMAAPATPSMAPVTASPPLPAPPAPPAAPASMALTAPAPAAPAAPIACAATAWVAWGACVLRAG